MRRLLCVLLLAIPTVATIQAEDVEILRDTYGTPHIFAATPAGAGFAAGYAQAEDRTQALLTNLRGAGEADPDTLSRAVRPMVNAYVAGINRYLQEHPELNAARVTAANVVAYSAHAFQWIHGSNDLLLAPSRTMSGSVIAVLDPLADWNAPDRPYEMTLYATEGDLAISGVAPPGVPFPIVGHSEYIVVGWSGNTLPGTGQTLDEAWALMTARTTAEARRALAMNRIPGDALVGTSSGEIFDSLGAPTDEGFLRHASGSKNGDADAREQLRVQRTWSAGRIEGLAFSTDVYQAGLWQARISKAWPESRFARRLSGWNRRADADSADALAFYLFKMELGPDAPDVAPPTSLSDARIRAALARAQDRLELNLEFGVKFGTLFRVTREGGRQSYPAGGGVLPEAGMETPRTILFRPPASKVPSAPHLSSAGQSATRVVELARAPTARSVLAPGESDRPESDHFDDQMGTLFSKSLTKPDYFKNRRELEPAVSSQKHLIF